MVRTIAKIASMHMDSFVPVTSPRNHHMVVDLNGAHQHSHVGGDDAPPPSLHQSHILQEESHAHSPIFQLDDYHDTKNYIPDEGNKKFTPSSSLHQPQLLTTQDESNHVIPGTFLPNDATRGVTQPSWKDTTDITATTILFPKDPHNPRGMDACSYAPPSYISSFHLKPMQLAPDEECSVINSFLQHHYPPPIDALPPSNESHPFIHVTSSSKQLPERKSSTPSWNGSPTSTWYSTQSTPCKPSTSSSHHTLDAFFSQLSLEWNVAECGDHGWCASSCCTKEDEPTTAFQVLQDVVRHGRVETFEIQHVDDVNCEVTLKIKNANIQKEEGKMDLVALVHSLLAGHPSHRIAHLLQQPPPKLKQNGFQVEGKSWSLLLWIL